MQQEKQSLRQYYQDLRHKQSGKQRFLPDVVSELSNLLSAHSGWLSLYQPFRGEIDPGFINDLWPKDHICLPKTSGNHMCFYPWQDGDNLSSGAFGIKEPLPTAPAVYPDVMILPLLACDRDGYRLGYGGGYYDRYLAEHDCALKIGIGFDCQYLEGDILPRENHDQRLDALLMPTRLIKFG